MEKSGASCFSISWYGMTTTLTPEIASATQSDWSCQQLDHLTLSKNGFWGVKYTSVP